MTKLVDQLAWTVLGKDRRKDRSNNGPDNLAQILEDGLGEKGERLVQSLQTSKLRRRGETNYKVVSENAIKSYKYSMMEKLLGAILMVMLGMAGKLYTDVQDMKVHLAKLQSDHEYFHGKRPAD